MFVVKQIALPPIMTPIICGAEKYDAAKRQFFLYIFYIAAVTTRFTVQNRGEKHIRMIWADWHWERI